MDFDVDGPDGPESFFPADALHFQFNPELPRHGPNPLKLFWFFINP
jgi:hypothetical protein